MRSRGLPPVARTVPRIGQSPLTSRGRRTARKIAVRLAIHRAVRRPREVSGDCPILGTVRATGGNPLERIVATENAASVRECLGRLRDLDRQTLVAFYFE